MSNYEKSTVPFVNPYNFISVEEKVDRTTNAEQKSEDLHTGYFECELKAYTPLAIPDVSKAKSEIIGKDKHHTYPAYKQNNQLVIPGSSIRGVLRSVYETATNSCMVTLDAEEQITKRSNINDTFKPGVLKNENGNWVLYSANRVPLVGDHERSDYKIIRGDYERFLIKREKDGTKYLEEGNQKIYWGEEVEIKDNGIGHKHSKTKRTVWKNSVSYIEKKIGTNCFLFLGEKIDSKHAESVFKVETRQKYSIEVVKNALKGLEETLLMYRSEAINRNLSKDHYGYRGYERAKNNGVIPLWYREANGQLYLSLAAIGRMTFSTPMGKLSNNHEPCKDRKCLCPACAVFGMVGKKENNKGLGSLIRVTDATVLENKGTSTHTLKELGSPRTSYLPFYSKNGKEYDSKDATIRGRKFYWHNPAVNKDATIYSTNEKTKRNGTFELINAESTFTFKVYYDALTSDQVDMLRWSLTLGDENSNLLHKIGHGKPLGLGSVKIIITNEKERDLSKGYAVVSNEVNDSSIPELLNKNAWRQLETILDYNHIKEDIRYPYIIEPEGRVKEIIEQKDKAGYVLSENVMANHQWFGKVNGGKNVTSKNLPFVTSTQLLYAGKLIGVEDKDFEREKKEGTIKFFNEGRGFGFIKCEGKEYYLPINQLRETSPQQLKPGTKVQFEIGEYKGKEQANNCRIKK